MLIAAVLAGEHAVLRVAHDGAPTFVHLANSSSNDQQPLTVSLPGLRSDDEILTRPFHEFWQQQGGALVVRFDPYYFNRQKTIEAIYAELMRLGRDKIILNLTSMGGRIGTDLIDYIRAYGNQIEVVGVIIKDSPMTASDIQGAEGWLGWIAAIIPGGGLTNTLYQWLKGEELPSVPLEPGVNRINLEAHWRAMSDWPLSGITSATRSIYWRTTLEPDTYKGPSLIIIRAAQDTLVAHNNQPWLDAFGGGMVITASSPDTEVIHAGFTEAPSAWLTAEVEAYGTLLPQ